ncbi:MAG: NAD(P)H-dependent oxidoreductase [Raineya sp.]|nr:NAD(P)H-dependent oxidoreductase [Raineya sp.]
MITIVVGTNRNDATSEIIAQHYYNILQSKQVDSEIVYLKDLPQDFVVSALYENEGKNPVFNAIREKVLNAEKIIFIVPEYNGSFPGVLKAFIDGMPYPNAFMDKKIALVGLSAGIQGGALALSHLSDIFSYLNAHVLGYKVKLIQIEKNMQNEQITNKFYLQLIDNQIEKFISF